MKKGVFDDVVVAAPVSFGYERFSTQPADWYFAQLLRELVRVAGIDKSEVDGVSASTFTLQPNPVASLSRSLGLSPTWMEAVPFGGASGVMALRRAARAVQAGDASIVACMGADANPRNAFKDLVSAFSVASTDAVFPYGAGGPTMPFAHVTRQYMEATGTKREQFGRLCVAHRFNSASCEHALLRNPITLQDYLDAPRIVDPLHKLDLVMPCAGAEGLLVMREPRARELGVPYARIRSIVERHNAFPDDYRILRGGWAQERELLFAQASLDPADIDVIAVYDDCPVIAFMQLEGLGLCEAGGAGRFVQEHDLRFSGDVPVNTSGGQLGCGQAGAAGGFLGMVEVLRQVTGLAGARQVRDARLGLASGYGMAVYDRCLGTAVAILEGA
jgi:acetyl-CoA acetyltransferase